MSKIIEFVESKIKNEKDVLKRLEKLKTISNKYELQVNESLKKNTEENIEYFQQIKCELEAWEVVKNKGLDIHYIIHCSSLEVFNCGLYKDYQLTEEEYQKIKKALGVEDEK